MNAMSVVRKPFLRLAPVALGLTAVPLMAETIAVIGTGNVGGALGPAFATQGHDVVYGSREPERADVQALVARTPGNAAAALPAEAVVGADIVVLAVPGAAAEDAVLSLGDLSGKIIIDPTNRVAPGEDGYFDHVAETSNGQLVQSLAPDARVVKAFNTLNYRTMVDPGGPVTIPLAGDDAGAKATVAELVAGMGLEPYDVGPIRSARVLEDMLTIWINARQAGTPYDYHFRRQDSPAP